MEGEDHLKPCQQCTGREVPLIIRVVPQNKSEHSSASPSQLKLPSLRDPVGILCLLSNEVSALLAPVLTLQRKSKAY